MKKLQLPSSYAVLSEEEQRTVSGGGELKDSLDEFFGSLHLYDFTMGGDLFPSPSPLCPCCCSRLSKTQ